MQNTLTLSEKLGLKQQGYLDLVCYLLSVSGTVYSMTTYLYLVK